MLKEIAGMVTKTLIACLAASASGGVFANEAEGRATPHESAHSGHHEPLGFDLKEHWFQEWQHARFSRRNTPYVHTFNLEPALLERDFSLNSNFVNGLDGENEIEVEAELEWAFTRRIGMVVELPFHSLDTEHDGTTSGVSDILLGPRLLTLDLERFILTTNLEFTVPTGDEDRHLGAGEVQLHPSVSLWLDLGNWFTLAGQIGYVHGVETGESDLRYRAALAYSFLTQGSRDHLDVKRFPRGLSSLIAEVQGRQTLSTMAESEHSNDVFLGGSYNVTGHWELRGGYHTPVGGNREFDSGVVFSMVYYF